MVQGLSPEAVEAIRLPSPSLDAQNASLRQLKNDIVGHDQRKELLVRQDLLVPLVSLLSQLSKASGKRSEPRGETSGQWTREDEIRLQAIQILNSVAGGGPAFIPPLVAAGVPRQLVDVLHPDSPARIITAALQGLRTLASTSAWMKEALDGQDQTVLGIVDENSAAAFEFILRQPCTDSTRQQQLKLVTEILTLCSTNETIRLLLATQGILDALASLLAAHSIENRHFLYRGYEHASATQFSHAPPSGLVSTIMAAIAAIIQGSNFRALRFILCQPLQDLLAYSFPSDDVYGTMYLQHSGPLACIEPLLPQLHVPSSKSVTHSAASRSFPAMNSLQTSERRPGSLSERRLTGWYADHALAVSGWIVFLARELRWAARLTALRLLALLNTAIEDDASPQSTQAEDTRRERDRKRQLALLAVPLAVALVQAAAEGKFPTSHTHLIDNDVVREEACEVLALLVSGSKALQTAAVEAGAIKRVCPILKKSFDSIPLAKPMWSARPPVRAETNELLPETCRMGPKGLPIEVLHAMRCRLGALEALAALARKEDTHRKAVIEARGVDCIIDSLKPFTPEVTADLAANKLQMTPKQGNTVSVILAACHAALSMSRSVSLLRTALIDAGIAMPLFTLLKHSDLEVRIAATDVCCNLLMDFAPMREDLINAGVIKSLAEHARQSEMRLRLSSLWALKHLVLQATKEIKLQCLEELGAGWLVGAIHGEHRETGAPLSTNGGVSVGLSSSNAVGEQVDLLNPSTMDVDDAPLHLNDGDGMGNETEEDDGDEEEEDDDEDGEVLYDEPSSTHYQESQLRSTLNKPPPAFHSKKYLSSIKDLESNPAVLAKRHDIAVQEQALDFLRNFIYGDAASTFVDHLIDEMGSSKLFALLTDKLTPVRDVSSSTTSSSAFANEPQQQQPPPPSSSHRPTSPIYQPTELLLSTIHLINHLANSSPKHKTLLIAQRPLLQAWNNHFTHPDRRVRVVSVLATTALVWIEDNSDQSAAATRMAELGAVGIEATVRSMAADQDLDVREKVKVAVRMFDGL